HPISVGHPDGTGRYAGLDIDQLFSPASVAKGYLEAIGVTPPLTRFTGVAAAGSGDSATPSRDQFLGYAMAAYFGGRAEVTLRHRLVPVVYCDILSTYTTVNSRLGNWGLLTAAELKLSPQESSYRFGRLVVVAPAGRVKASSRAGGGRRMRSSRVPSTNLAEQLKRSSAGWVSAGRDWPGAEGTHEKGSVDDPRVG
ncbi:MAG: hypothetical protein ACRD6W_04300, partial [Nitrososphaerales archaeon]